MSLNKKSELQTDWIDRLEGRGEKAPWWSMNEVQDFVHQQVPRTSSKDDKWTTFAQAILDGASLSDMGAGNHTHTEKQLANLRNNPDLMDSHVKDHHFGGNAWAHDSYHN